MSRTLPSTLRDLALAIRSHSNAWASARDTANKAHLAAVMGPWKLCGTCLLEVKSTGKPVQLVDGSMWGRNTGPDKGKQARMTRATHELNAMRTAGANIPKKYITKSARKAAARKRKREAEAQEERACGAQEPDDDASADGAQARNAAAGGLSTEDLFQELRAKRKLKAVKRTKFAAQSPEED